MEPALGSSVRLFRAMRQEGAVPKIGPTARTLGVRPGVDVDASNPNEFVGPRRQQGMSVSPDNPENLPDHRRPVSVGGVGRDPVWYIDTDELGPALQFVADRPDHGVIEPANEMTLAEFQTALAETQSRWTKLDD